MQILFLPRLNGTDLSELKPRGYSLGAETERRRPAVAAIVVSAQQPASTASPRAMPGEREISRMLEVANSTVAKSPASGANLEARRAVKITTVGAKNGTIARA